MSVYTLVVTDDPTGSGPPGSVTSFVSVSVVAVPVAKAARIEQRGGLTFPTAQEAVRFATRSYLVEDTDDNAAAGAGSWLRRGSAHSTATVDGRPLYLLPSMTTTPTSRELIAALELADTPFIVTPNGTRLQATYAQIRYYQESGSAAWTWRAVVRGVRSPQVLPRRNTQRSTARTTRRRRRG